MWFSDHWFSDINDSSDITETLISTLKSLNQCSLITDITGINDHWYHWTSDHWYHGVSDHWYHWFALNEKINPSNSCRRSIRSGPCFPGRWGRMYVGSVERKHTNSRSYFILVEEFRYYPATRDRRTVGPSGQLRGLHSPVYSRIHCKPLPLQSNFQFRFSSMASTESTTIRCTVHEYKLWFSLLFIY